MKPTEKAAIFRAVWNRLRGWGKKLKRDVMALYLAAGDPRVPWYAKALAVVIASYALSPIDLIPDFIPVLGYLDDAILLPLGLYLVIKMIPPGVMAEYRAKAATIDEQPASWKAAVVVICIWVISLGVLGGFLYRSFGS